MFVEALGGVWYCGKCALSCTTGGSDDALNASSDGDGRWGTLRAKENLAVHARGGRQGIRIADTLEIYGFVWFATG